MYILFDLVSKKNTDKVARYLQEGIDVNRRDDHGWTPVYYASLNSDAPMVALLKKHGADFSIRSYEGFTMLSSVCLSGNSSALRLLLKHGADPNQCNKDERTPLQFALIRDQFDQGKLVEILLKRGALPDKIDNNGSSPLHQAVCYQDLNAVKSLLSYGANVNVLNVDGETPLFYAYKNNQYEMISILLEHGANPQAKNLQGLPPMHYGSNETNSFFNRLHSSKEVCEDMLMDELNQEKVDLAKLNALIYKLTEGGKFPQNLIFTREDDLGTICTPLQMAVLNTTNMNVLKTLSDANPQLLNQADPQYGWTPLHMAAMHQKTDIVKFLILAGANSQKKDFHPSMKKTYEDYLRDPKFILEMRELCEKKNGFWKNIYNDTKQFIQQIDFSNMGRTYLE